MTCFTPNQGYEKKGLTKNGKFGFTNRIDMARRVDGIPVRRTVPCRTCEGCRNDNAREWSVKLLHESLIHIENNELNCSFVTLTYNDDFIPAFGALDYFDHWNNFLKRLRRALEPKKIRYFIVGEYGEKNLRPHYHVIIFGYNFPDRTFHCYRHGNPIYRSKFLEKLWTVPRGRPDAGKSLGYSSVGDVSHASLAYVARYSMKKVIGKEKERENEIIIPHTGEIVPAKYLRYHPENGDHIIVPAERHFHSNVPGIGAEWFKRYGMQSMYRKYYHQSSDTFVYDVGTHLPNGKMVGAPKYYDKLLEKIDPSMLENIKLSRQDYMARHASEFTPENLAAKRKNFLAKMQPYKRESWRIYDAT